MRYAALRTGLLGLLLLMSLTGFAQPRDAAADSLLPADLNRSFDQQASELQQLPGAQVARVDQGIRLSLATTLLFESTQAHLRLVGRAALDSLTAVLQRYPHTTVAVLCPANADHSTTPAYQLAASRARAVRSVVMMHGVVPERIWVQDAGATQLSSPPELPAGQVEIIISAGGPPVQGGRAGLHQEDATHTSAVQ